MRKTGGKDGKKGRLSVFCAIMVAIMRSHARPLSSPHDAKSERPFQSSDTIFVLLCRRYCAKRPVWLENPRSEPPDRWAEHGEFTKWFLRSISQVSDCTKASLLYSKSIRSRGTFVILHRLLPVVRATTSDAYRFRMTDCLEM